MTRAILAAGGKAELIRTFNNPFAFFYLYNAAALKNPALPCLSNSAVTALQNLERRIIPSPEKKLASAALARGVDVSALDLLWPIISLLAKDEEPNASLWDRFFGHPGYRVYFGWEGDSRTSLKNAMSLTPGVKSLPTKAA